MYRDEVSVRRAGWRGSGLGGELAPPAVVFAVDGGSENSLRLRFISLPLFTLIRFSYTLPHRTF
jgi:hypothetical protein